MTNKDRLWSYTCDLFAVITQCVVIIAGRFIDQRNRPISAFGSCRL